MAPPVSLTLGARGMWLWMPEDYAVTPEECRKLGVSWIVPRGCVSFRRGGMPQHALDGNFVRTCTPAWIQNFQSHGIAVGAFGYPMSENVQQAGREADSIESLFSEGIDFFVHDMEEHYEEEGAEPRSGFYVDELHRRLPNLGPMFDAPWAWIGSHPRFVPTLRRLAPLLAAHMPQAYTTAFGFSRAAPALERMDLEWKAENAARKAADQRPIYPIFGLFDRVSMLKLGQRQDKYGLLDPDDVERFEARYHGAPISYWSLHTARLDALDRLASLAAAESTDPPPQAPPPPPPAASEGPPRGAAVSLQLARQQEIAAQAAGSATIEDVTSAPPPSPEDDAMPTQPSTPKAKLASQPAPPPPSSP